MFIICGERKNIMLDSNLDGKQIFFKTIYISFIYMNMKEIRTYTSS